MTQPFGEQILDSGGQAERTRLSWNRTGLALAVNGALLVHTGGGSLLWHVPALTMLLVAVVCFVFADHRYRQINRAVQANQQVAVITHMRAVAVLTVIPAIIALVGILR